MFSCVLVFLITKENECFLCSSEQKKMIVFYVFFITKENENQSCFPCSCFFITKKNESQSCFLCSCFFIKKDSFQKL